MSDATKLLNSSVSGNVLITGVRCVPTSNLPNRSVWCCEGPEERRRKLQKKITLPSIREIARLGINRLPFWIRYELFYQAARTLGVKSYEVTGKCGNFFGPLSDQTVTKGYLRSREHSPYILALLQEFFSRSGGGTFYDVGANIGLVTIPIAQNPRVACTAYEPDAENFRLLRANIVGNCPYPNVTAVNAAVYSENTELSFKRNAYNCGDHHISGHVTGVRVRAVTLDSNPPAAGPFAVKIDTQGAEPAVFSGGHNTLASADLVVAEFWPWGMARLGAQKPELMITTISTIFSYGRIIDHDRPGPCLRIDAITEKLRDIMRRAGEFEFVDVVLSRSREQLQ